MERELCRLQYAAGRIEPCPGDACPFWQEGACAIGGLRADLDENPELVDLLLHLRGALAGERRSVFGRLPGRRRRRPGGG